MRFAEPFIQYGKSAEAKLEAERLMFLELTQGLQSGLMFDANTDCTSVCLWGNSTDLSLLINMTEEQIKTLQSTGGDHLASTEKNILGNHLNQIWDAVKELRDKTGGRIDFVLDNAGFELYCDCVYGSYGDTLEYRYHRLNPYQPTSSFRVVWRSRSVSMARDIPGLFRM